MSYAKDDLIPVQMRTYWMSVLELVNEKLGNDAGKLLFTYISDVYHGNRKNIKVDEILDECIEKVNKDYAKRGIRSRYPIEPRNRKV